MVNNPLNDKMLDVYQNPIAKAFYDEKGHDQYFKDCISPFRKEHLKKFDEDFVQCFCSTVSSFLQNPDSQAEAKNEMMGPKDQLLQENSRQEDFTKPQISTDKRREIFVFFFIVRIVPKFLVDFAKVQYEGVDLEIASAFADRVGQQAVDFFYLQRTLIDWDRKLLQESDWNVLLGPVFNYLDERIFPFQQYSLLGAESRLRGILSPITMLLRFSANAVEFAMLYHAYVALRHHQMFMEYSNKVSNLYQKDCQKKIVRFILPNYREEFDDLCFLKSQPAEDVEGSGPNFMFGQFLENLADLLGNGPIGFSALNNDKKGELLVRLMTAKTTAMTMRRPDPADYKGDDEM
eukprot:CRZ05371.1 hypothetical protein [Spongospora subterranea]